ncbi:MAG: 23S rRNA (guanosine(2251)-2'-O)-methyltransferase RlmB [Pseudomonadota bacterium]
MKADRSRLVAGINPVIAALSAKATDIERILVVEDTQNQRVRDIELMARDAGITVVAARRDQLDELTGLERHQDVVAELGGQVSLDEAGLESLLEGLDEAPLLLVLDGVTDPHNLGACLRTAEAAGVHAVIVPKDRAAGLTPAARKASAGASEVLPLVQVTNLARTLRTLKDRGIWLYGTTGRADNDLYAQDLKGPLALVMGSEGDGLRRLTAETCDFLVSIPLVGAIESLNVSVATGVCLFEVRRQRGSS